MHLSYIRKKAGSSSLFLLCEFSGSRLKWWKPYENTFKKNLKKILQIELNLSRATRARDE
jgi:hypothetical protein